MPAHSEQGTELTPGHYVPDTTNGGIHYEKKLVTWYDNALIKEGWYETPPPYQNENGDWVHPNSIYHKPEYTTVLVEKYVDIAVENSPIWVLPTYEQVWVETTYKQTWVDPVYTQVWVPPGTSQVWVDPVYGTRTVTVPYTIPETAGGDTVAFWGSGVNSYEQAASNKRIKFAGNPGSVPGAPAQSTVTATAPAAGTVISFVINGYLKVEW